MKASNLRFFLPSLLMIALAGSSQAAAPRYDVIRIEAAGEGLTCRDSLSINSAGLMAGSSARLPSAGNVIWAADANGHLLASHEFPQIGTYDSSRVAGIDSVGRVTVTRYIDNGTTVHSATLHPQRRKVTPIAADVDNPTALDVNARGAVLGRGVSGTRFVAFVTDPAGRQRIDLNERLGFSLAAT